jgi:hypothetical protein
MPTLETWEGNRSFEYTGSVPEGTEISLESGGTVMVSARQYATLVHAFRGRAVDIGLSDPNPSPGSVGEWLQESVTRTPIASYVGPILIAEGYAQRAGDTLIKFKR